MKCTILDWSDRPQPLSSEMQGAAYGTRTSLIFNHLQQDGEGAALHRHPYAETFVIWRGQVMFTDGRSNTVARAGQIVIVAPQVPHAFRAIGGEPVEMLDIHDNGRFVTEWLSSPPNPFREKDQ